MDEGLNSRIKVAIMDRSLVGIPLHDLTPPPTNNQFVDDTLLMGVPSIKKATTIQAIQGNEHQGMVEMD